MEYNFISPQIPNPTTLNFTNLTNGTLEVMLNCKVTNYKVVDETHTLTLMNGVYRFTNNNVSTVYFHLDNETLCKLYEHKCNKLYNLYTALTLGQYCPAKYGDLCMIYDQLITQLNNDCNDCL